MLLLLGLLLVMLVLVAGATTNSTHFEQLYAWLLLASAVGLAVLAALILYNLISLLALYRRQVPGARLILRLVGIFAVLAITPVALVYGFSLNFLQRGIDSWFNVQVDAVWRMPWNSAAPHWICGCATYSSRPRGSPTASPRTTESRWPGVWTTCSISARLPS